MAKMTKHQLEHRRPVRLCIIVTAPVSLFHLYRNQFQYLEARGYKVFGIAGPGKYHELVRGLGVDTRVVPFCREPNVFRDIYSLVCIFWFLLWHRFDIVHVSTPKAALLGTIAARCSGHHRVIYTLRGRTYENCVGWKRKFFQGIEWAICHLVRYVIPICNALGSVVVKEKLCSPKKIRTIAWGSSNGIDSNLFHKTPNAVCQGQELRVQFDIPDDSVVILSVGRIRREKGINELVKAFVKIQCETKKDVHLVLVGEYEPQDPVQPDIASEIQSNTKIHSTGQLPNPVPAYAMADILAFPTYREGFGNVAIEASAMELPVVASDIMGCREAVDNGVTGILVPPFDADALAAVLLKLVESPDLCRQLGQAGRKHVLERFQQKKIWDGNIAVYQELLNQ